MFFDKEARELSSYLQWMKLCLPGFSRWMTKVEAVNGLVRKNDVSL